MHELDVRTRRRREKWVWRCALLGSAFLHLLVLLLGGGRTIPLAGLPAGPEEGDDRAASGALQAMNMVIPPPPPIERPFIPIPVDIEIEMVEFDMDQVFDESAFLGERPGVGEAGIETGDGAGNGGSDGEGRGHIPKPKNVIWIPDVPKGLRMKVWVFVDELGDVVADSTWLQPPSRDRRFNERMISEAAEWLFRPAIRNGIPVAAWFSWEISR